MFWAPPKSTNEWLTNFPLRAAFAFAAFVAWLNPFFYMVCSFPLGAGSQNVS